MRKVDDGIEVSDVTVQMDQRGNRARAIAVRSIVDNEEFYELPRQVAEGIVLIGYLRNVHKHKLSKRLGLSMLQEDLQHIDAALRGKIFLVPEMNDTRYASLMYLSAAVGVDQVLRNTELWRALKAADYIAAQWAMLRMYWTFKVVPAEDKKAQTRLMQIAEMMRSGEEKPAAA